MSIIYPSINTSNFATLGSNTFIGTEIVTGSVDITNRLSASAITASELLLTNNPYATTGGVSASFANLTNTVYFPYSAYFQNDAAALVAEGNLYNNGDTYGYSQTFLQGAQQSILYLRRGAGYDNGGKLYTTNEATPSFVIEARSGIIQVTGTTQFSNSVSASALYVSDSFSANSSSFNAVTLTGSLVYANPKVNITTANSGVVDQFTGSYKATRYTIMAETTTGTYHVQTADVLLAHNNSNVLITPYAVTCTSGSYLASFDAQYSGSNIQLIATNLVASNIAVTMTKTYLA